MRRTISSKTSSWEAAAMTDTNTGVAKIIKMKTKFEYSFSAFLDQLQSHVGVIATTCFV